MTKTALDVASRALELLTVKPLSQGADAHDAAKAKQAYTGLLAELSDVEGMAFEWGEDETPEWAFEAMSGIVAARLAPTYMMQFDGRGYRRRLNMLVLRDDRAPGEPTPATYF
jgi:hypothetical protein